MSDAHSAAGSYAVDALGPDERERFEDHLEDCVSCRLEIAEFAETLAQLSPLTVARPPLALRASVLTAVAGVRQAAPRLAARTADGADLVADEGREAAPRRAMPTQVTDRPPLEPEDVVPLEEHPSVVPVTPWHPPGLTEDLDETAARPRNRWFPALVAAVLVAVLALGGWVFLDQRQQRAATAENQILAASDVQFHQGSVGSATFTFAVSKDRNQALFFGQGFAAPGEDELYELWTLRDGQATPAGLVSTDGEVRVLIGDLVDADTVAMSVEPAPRGVAQPTKDAVFYTADLT